MLSIDVAISTHKPEGIARVVEMLPSQKEGVNYIVSWQEHDETPIPSEILQRSDIKVYRLDKKGLSNNRNNAINHCRGDIILIADDDLEYYNDFDIKIRKAFQEDNSLDLALFKVKYSKTKNYPENSCHLNYPLPKNYYAASVEIAFRRKKLPKLRFWEKMGLGNPLLSCGEDELFVAAAVKQGKTCYFINETIASHPHSTTGEAANPGILRAQGFLTKAIYPFSAFLRIPLKAIRLKKNINYSLWKSLKYLSKGALLKTRLWNTIPPEDRW